MCCLVSFPRLTGTTAVLSSRVAAKDFTFSDGTFIPAGTMVTVATDGPMRDEAFFPDATKFDPWRFSRMREKEGEGIHHQLVTIGQHNFSFGVGRHAWCVPFLSRPSSANCALCKAPAASSR